MLRIKPGTAGCESRMLPLCYAPPPRKQRFHLKVGLSMAKAGSLNNQSWPLQQNNILGI